MVGASTLEPYKQTSSLQQSDPLKERRTPLTSFQQVYLWKGEPVGGRVVSRTPITGGHVALLSFTGGTLLPLKENVEIYCPSEYAVVGEKGLNSQQTPKCKQKWKGKPRRMK